MDAVAYAAGLLLAIGFVYITVETFFNFLDPWR